MTGAKAGGVDATLVALIMVAGLTLAGMFGTRARAQAIVWPRASMADVQSVFQLPRPGYDEPGITLGSFLLRPSVAESVEYDDNIFSSQVRNASDVVTTTSESARFQSQWSRDSLELDFLTDQQIYTEHHRESAKTYEADLAARLDIDSSSFLELDGIGAQQPDLRAAPVALLTTQRPTFDHWGGNLRYYAGNSELSEQFQISVQQIAYIFPLEIYESYVAKTLGDRLTLHEGQPFSPFVEASYVKNDQVFNPDRQNFRNAQFYIGFDTDYPGIFESELAVGLLQENFTYMNFKTLTRPVMDGNFLWNATPLTSVIGKFALNHNGIESFCNVPKQQCEITSSGNGGPIISPIGGIYYQTHRSTVESIQLKLNVEHEVWHDILIDLGVEYDRNSFDFNGLVDDQYNELAELRYLANQYTELSLSYAHHVRTANLPNDFSFNTGPYTEDSVFLTAKFGL